MERRVVWPSVSPRFFILCFQWARLCLSNISTDCLRVVHSFPLSALLCSVLGECKTKDEVAGRAVLYRTVRDRKMSYHYIIAISSTECVYVPRRAQACLREPQEPCVKGGTWWCVTHTSLAALHMTGRANGGWKALKWLHSGKAGLRAAG